MKKLILRKPFKMRLFHRVSPASPSQNCPGGRTITFPYLDRQADQVVPAWFNLGKVQTFKDPHLRAQQDLMGLNTIPLVTAHGKIIDANGLDAALDHVPRRSRRDVDKPLLKPLFPPAGRGIVGAQQNALAPPNSPSKKGCFLSARDE
ncbi:MAG TPA: hypothetical protein VHH73_01425 [Verrucomicrobiae bacterium]|nr:hypothetical protein [Verrucomicrobiae bacterium]